MRPWLNLSTQDRLHLVASYFHFAGTAYNPTDQKNTNPVVSALRNLRETSGDTGSIKGSAAESQKSGSAPVNSLGAPGQLFEDIQAIVLVEEDTPEGWDPLWIVCGRRKE